LPSRPQPRHRDLIVDQSPGHPPAAGQDLRNGEQDRQVPVWFAARPRQQILVQADSSTVKLGSRAPSSALIAARANSASTTMASPAPPLAARLASYSPQRAGRDPAFNHRVRRSRFQPRESSPSPSPPPPTPTPTPSFDHPRTPGRATHAPTNLCPSRPGSRVPGPSPAFNRAGLHRRWSSTRPNPANQPRRTFESAGRSPAVP
jgi:hypothetical protein